MSAGEPRRIPRFLGCLVKGPLGCLAFALGAFAVLVLFLPPAAGRLVDGALERWFSERFAGRLELGDAWLGSFYGPQRIERLILRDPEGDEVLRGVLDAPSLYRSWDGSEPPYGPVVLKVELLRLVQAEDGSSNLERALASLPQVLEPTVRSGLETDVPFEVELELRIERLRFSSSAGREDQLADLVFHGTLAWGPDATRIVLEGGSDPAQAEPLRVRVELERPEFGPRRPWASSLTLEGVPTALVRVLCAAFRPLAPLTGPRLDRLEWSRQGQEVGLECADDGARFELRGVEEDGLVRPTAEGRVVATLPCAHAGGGAWLRKLCPLVSELECEDAARAHELTLAGFAWPLDGALGSLAGTLELALAPLRCAPAPALVSLLGARTSLAGLALESPQRFTLAAGGLEYAAVHLVLATGRLRLDGRLDLASGRSELVLAGELDGAPLEPLARISAELGGVPRLTPVEPPSSPPPVKPAPTEGER